MNCRNCDKWDGYFGYCTVCSCKPRTTGNPATCPYYKPKVG